MPSLKAVNIIFFGTLFLLAAGVIVIELSFAELISSVFGIF